jgi:hypothetical protein
VDVSLTPVGRGCTTVRLGAEGTKLEGATLDHVMLQSRLHAGSGSPEERLLRGALDLCNETVHASGAGEPLSEFSED